MERKFKKAETHENKLICRERIFNFLDKLDQQFGDKNVYTEIKKIVKKEKKQQEMTLDKKEEIKRYKHEYYLKNKEKYKVRNKEYREKNKI